MNIELHGFDQNVAGRLIDEIWQKLITSFNMDVELRRFVVTSVPVTTRNVHGRTTPFFRIFSDQEDDFRVMATLLREVETPGVTLRTVIECVLLYRKMSL